MAKNDPQVNVRMPESLVERLRQEAEANGQTLAGEIISRLEASFPKSFDLIMLEHRQRDLKELQQRHYWMKRAILEKRHELPPDVIAAGEKEVEAMEKSIRQLRTELDEMYKQFANSELLANQ